SEQIETLGGEELDHIRGAHRLLVAAAQPDRLDRRPLDADTVGVRRVVGAVIRIAIAAVDAQQIRPWLAFHDRDAHLGKRFLDGELTGEADNRTALARQVEGRKFGVGFEAQLLDATLEAERNADAGLGPRRSPAVLPEVGRQRRTLHLLLRRALLQTWRLQIGK